MDARKRAIQNAPQVVFSNEPPMELHSVNIKAPPKDVKIGYISFGTASSIDLLFPFDILHLFII